MAKAPALIKPAAPTPRDYLTGLIGSPEQRTLDDWVLLLVKPTYRHEFRSAKASFQSYLKSVEFQPLVGTVVFPSNVKKQGKPAKWSLGAPTMQDQIAVPNWQNVPEVHDFIHYRNTIGDRFDPTNPKDQKQAKKIAEKSKDEMELWRESAQVAFTKALTLKQANKVLVLENAELAKDKAELSHQLEHLSAKFNTELSDESLDARVARIVAAQVGAPPADARV